MTATVNIAQGHDITYLTGKQGEQAGHVGGVAYYMNAVGKEPPGVWAGKGAGRLGLAGMVSEKAIVGLYHHGVTPAGERLAGQDARSYQDKEVAIEEATLRYMEKYRANHPFASSKELDEARANFRAVVPQARPYYDVTLSAAKSVSVVHASLMIDAMEHREAGDVQTAVQLEADARAIEDAVLATARALVEDIEETAAFVRTGHHPGGEWRDAAGVVAALFLQHLSYEGDPSLHVHVAVLNRAQRADGEDGKWRALDGTRLYQQKEELLVLADRDLEVRLAKLGWRMKMRPDGLGCEIDGVPREVIEEYSTRTVAMTPALREAIWDWQQATGNVGKEPTPRTIAWIKHEVWQDTRMAAFYEAEALRKKGVKPPADLEPAERLRWYRDRAVRRLAVKMDELHGTARGCAPGRPRPVLSYEAKARAARVAVARVQEEHATWSRAKLIYHVGRALPEMPDDAFSRALVREVADLAVSGRAGTDAVMVTAPDIADVSSLGVRDSDGVSIYRPPLERRWTTLGHLDTEGRILETALRPSATLVRVAEAKAVAAQTDLSAAQQDALVRMLTAPTSTTALVAPAGAGKSHTMAEFSRVWHEFTGGRVIGLTTSTNAARVLQGEGLAEAYNIAAFLGKIEGSDELRHPVTVTDRDVLVIDEASQVNTADLALIQEAARTAGARTVMTGDTQQLGAVGAGGMFRLLVQELLRRGAAAELHEVRRFAAQWERGASVRLRAGDFAAYTEYDRHGRIRAGDQETARDQAVTSWLADVLEGKRSLLMAGSNAEVADLSARAQSKLIGLGAVQRPQVKLSDGNSAGIGDLIRARLNTEIDAGGQKLTNRDTLRVTAWKGRHAEVERRRADGSWSAKFIVPGWYMENSAELDYGANSHVAQGRNVETGHPLVSPTLTRQQFYVLMTRGTLANTAHVDTGPAAGQGKDYQQATAETVVKAILQRDDADLSATEEIRHSQEHITSAGHLLTLYGAITKAEAYPEIDQAIVTRLGAGDAARYMREHARPVLQGLLRRAEIEGRDVRGIIEAITADPMDGARSVSGVLHGRARAELSTQPERTRTWAERTPGGAHPLAHEIAAAIDARTAELGRRQAEEPQPWAIARRGEIPEDQAGREAWTRSVGIAALHREAQGVTDPEQDTARGRHPEPVFEVARQDAVRELGVPDDQAQVRAASRGELEAHVLDGYRVLATAPPDVSGELRLTAQAEADARADTAAAQVNRDEAQALQFRALGDQLAARTAELEEAQAARDEYDRTTDAVRSRADLARAELKHRGYDPILGYEPETSDPEPDREQDPAAYVEWALRQSQIHDAGLAQAAREKLAHREAAAQADAEAELAEELELLDAGEEAEPGVPSQADKYTLAIMGQHLQHGAELRGGGGGEPPDRAGGRHAAEPAADGSPFWQAGFRDGPERDGPEADTRPSTGRDEPAAGRGRRATVDVDDLLARMDAELAAAERRPQAQPEPQPEPAAGVRGPGPEREAEPEPEPDDHLARIDASLARSHEALERIQAEEAEHQARAEYAARIEREAELDGPSAALDAEIADPEIEP